MRVLIYIHHAILEKTQGEHADFMILPAITDHFARTAFFKPVRALPDRGSGQA
jgi:hypothetical protein